MAVLLIGPVGSVLPPTPPAAISTATPFCPTAPNTPISVLKVHFDSTQSFVCGITISNVGSPPVTYGTALGTKSDFFVSNPDRIRRFYGSASDTCIYRLGFQTEDATGAGNTFGDESGTIDPTEGNPFEFNIPSGLQCYGVSGFTDSNANSGIYLRAIGIFVNMNQTQVAPVGSLTRAPGTALKFGAAGTGREDFFDESWGWRDSTLQSITINDDGSGVTSITTQFSNMGLLTHGGGTASNSTPVVVNQGDSICCIHGTHDGSKITSLGVDLIKAGAMQAVPGTGVGMPFSLNIPDNYAVTSFWGWASGTNLVAIGVNVEQWR